MATFVDTSAFFALLDERDGNYDAARSWMTGPGADAAEVLVTTNYVVVETTALLDRRLGRDAVRVFLNRFIPTCTVSFVDVALHAEGMAAFLAAPGSGPSLVDCISFATMSSRGVRRAFAFDADFARQGFETVP